MKKIKTYLSSALQNGSFGPSIFAHDDAKAGESLTKVKC
jgi:hypothetical protein